MKALVKDFSTDIVPTDEEVRELCKPGQGADTCSWLIMGANGFECCCHNKPHALLDRRSKGQMIAMRDGCDKVKEFSPLGIGMGEHSF